MSDELIAKLKKLTERKCWCDDLDSGVFEYSGENIDDAYSGGWKDGEAKLAAEILKELGLTEHL